MSSFQTVLRSLRASKRRSFPPFRQENPETQPKEPAAESSSHINDGSRTRLRRAHSRLRPEPQNRLVIADKGCGPCGNRTRFSPAVDMAVACDHQLTKGPSEQFSDQVLRSLRASKRRSFPPFRQGNTAKRTDGWKPQPYQRRESNPQHLSALEPERAPVTDRIADKGCGCLLYTSPSPRDRTRSRMPSSA